ncbi:MAG: phage recombination protein Bet [Syntrophus sp. (in: bacteria)]
MAGQNLPAVNAEKKETSYVAADGQEVRLTPDIVKKYLVQGKGELVTVPELMYFLNICRARRMNPLVKDCYLVKYTDKENAAIITSVDFFRKRARAQKDCKGWKKGVIVKTKDGKVRDSYGLVLKDEELVGGWFEAQPEGWLNPFRLEVNLSGYLKKTSEGKITRFWQPDNQPTMIAKVAEAQGLRSLWPDEFQRIYSEDEMPPPGNDAMPLIDVAGEDAGANFDSLIPDNIDRAALDKYLSVCSNHFKRTVEEIKSEASKNMAAFLAEFGKWLKRQEKTGKKEATANPAEPMSGPCPNNGDSFKESFCVGCPDRAGCPAWS